MAVNVPFYTPRLPVRSGSGHIQDLSEGAERNKLILAQAIGSMLGNVYGRGKQQRQTRQQIQQVAPILAREGDTTANLQEALRVISETTAKRPTGFRGVMDFLNPFAPARGGGTELEQAIIQNLMERGSKVPWWAQGMTAEEAEKYKQKQISGIPKAALPEDYKADLASAVDAIKRGADPQEVFRRISTTYPERSAELRRILLETGKNIIVIE